MKTNTIFALLMHCAAFTMNAQVLTENLLADAYLSPTPSERSGKINKVKSDDPKALHKRATSTYDLFGYLYGNIRYPEIAQENAIQGKVIAQVSIDAQGAVSDVKIIKELGFGCDEEVIRVLKAMPAWEPAIQNGKAIAQNITIPLHFRLQ